MTTPDAMRRNHPEAESTQQEGAGDRSLQHFTAALTVMPRESVLDPQGETTLGALQRLGFAGIVQCRIGRRMVLQIMASSAGEARQIAEKACITLLSNPVTEDFAIDISKDRQR